MGDWYEIGITLGLGVAAGLLLATSADKADAANLAGRNVKIGCLASLTGKGAEWGQAAKISMDIAVQEINAKGGIGGIPAELICYDTQTLEAEALKLFGRLVERVLPSFAVIAPAEIVSNVRVRSLGVVTLE